MHPIITRHILKVKAINHKIINFENGRTVADRWPLFCRYSKTPLNEPVSNSAWIVRQWNFDFQGKHKMGKSIWELGIEDLVKTGLNLHEAVEFNRILKNVLSTAQRSKPAEVWRELMAKRALKPTHPFELHRLLYYSVYANWNISTNGPPPYWFPSL